MLVVTCDHTLFQVFFCNSQNNLHNFTRHWNETNGPWCSDGLPTLWPPEPIISTEDRQRRPEIRSNLSTLSMSLFVRQPSSSSNRPMSSLVLHLLQTYFNMPFLVSPPRCWPASTLIELWPYNFFPTVLNSTFVVLPGCLTSILVDELTPLLKLDEIWLVQLMSYNSLNRMLTCSSDSAILAIFIDSKYIYIL